MNELKNVKAKVVSPLGIRAKDFVLQINNTCMRSQVQGSEFRVVMAVSVDIQTVVSFFSNPISKYR